MYVLGVYALSVEFPKKYPFTQPEIRFLTPVWLNYTHIVYSTTVRYIIAMLVAAVGGYVMQYLESHTHPPLV